jgi:hypothetical protein
MTRASLLIAAVAVVACTSNPLTVATGEFSAPTGLAATAAADRDLLFIANTGRDSLRALQFCNAPLLLDGGVDPADTCPQSAHRQFIPAPIRLFPASIETGDRPLRVAGVRLNRSDGSAAGVALVAGAGSSLAVIDGRSLVDTQTTGTAPRAVLQFDPGQGADGGTAADGGSTAAETVDVVAANPLDTRFDLETGAATVTAFAATHSELLVLDVTLGTDGFAQVPTVRGRCTLDPVVPTRLAVVPGSDARVYVADGAGDGVVSIQTSSVPAGGGPCVMDRIRADGRSVRSIALSPPWYDQDNNGQPRTHPAGELLLMVLEPLPTSQPGQTADPGGVLFAGTGLGLVPKGIVPIPPFDPATEVAEPMRPLSLPNPGGLFNEGAFLRAVKPKAAPEPPDLTACPTAPCTPLSIGQPAGAAPVLFPLLAAVSCSDGVTYFIDVANRRLVNQNKYAQVSDLGILPIVNGSGPLFGPAIPAPPTLTLDATKFEPGVTHASSWRVVWHAAIPGLERRGGTITPVNSDTLRFTVPLPNLNLFRDDTAIALAADDVVSLTGYSIGTDNSPACQTVVSSESTPFRFELKIKDVQPDHLDLQVLQDQGSTLGFHPQGCSAFGAVAEVRTARTQPWLVFDGNTVKGRVRDDGTFDARQPRFDYPRSDPAYGKTQTDVPPAPIASRDLAFSFVISGPLPDTPQEAGSRFTWSISSGVFPVAYGDQLHNSAGFATAVYGYSSRRTQDLAFTSVTGMNEVLQADPFLLNSTTTVGLVAYR